MAKEAVLQVRMDAELKEKAEKLYKDMGTSLSEAVRIFAMQSIKENGMPFKISADRKSAFGRLASYSDKTKISEEMDAMEKALISNYEDIDRC